MWEITGGEDDVDILTIGVMCRVWLNVVQQRIGNLPSLENSISKVEFIANLRLRLGKRMTNNMCLERLNYEAIAVTRRTFRGHVGMT